MTSVHPDASRRITELSGQLVSKFSRVELPSTPDSHRYAPDIPAVHTISGDDILGHQIISLTDRFGREIARQVADDQGLWGLQGADFSEFLKAVRTFHGQSAVRAVVSEGTVAKLFFEWIYETKRGRTSTAVLDYLLPRIDELIADIEIIMPIFGLNVEAPIKIGNVVIADVTAAEFDAWQDTAVNQVPDKQDDITQLFARLRNKYQGRAAARYATRAERQHAIDTGLAEADLSVAIIRLFSVGAFVPERPTNVALLGRQHLPSAAYLLMDGDGSMSVGEFLLHNHDLDPWVITNDKLPALELTTRHWSELLRRQQRSAFEKAALRAMLLYSRATQYRNTSEKLIHIFSATESLLLRSDSEPIVSAVAERLAFLAGTTTDARIRIDRNLRDVYGMRSRFVHHALETPPEGDDLGKLEDFLAHISQFFINLKEAMEKHATKDSFLDELQRRKYE